ncbi:MAG: hypothetical protein ACI4SL_11145 [Candidatus Ornithospirochaeta sp.]
MKEKEKKVKEIRIPRLAVYLIALFTAIVICIAMSLSFGIAYAAEFATVAIFNCVIAFVAYNIIDKWDEQPWRLTPKYWGLVALILMSDVLWILSAKSSTKYWGLILFIGFLASVGILAIYTAAIYVPSQRQLLAEVKQKVKDAVAQYISDHSGESPEQVAEGLVELVMAPKEHVVKEGENE